MHHLENNSTPPGPILPPAVIICPIQWSIDDQITEATCLEPALLRGPEGLIYVPSPQCLFPMDSVHTSLGSGDAGSQKKNQYWWPNITQDVSRYVKGCSVCAISNTPCHLPEGKYHYIVHTWKSVVLYHSGFHVRPATFRFFRSFLCSKFPSSNHHWIKTVQMHTLFPARPVSLVMRAVGYSSCVPLVPGE